MVANKYILGLALCIVYTLLACKDKPQKPTRIKRLPTVDSSDTFLFYKLPPADFTPKMDSTHIGYWSNNNLYRDELWVDEYYYMNKHIYYNSYKIQIYSDSLRLKHYKVLLEDFKLNQKQISNSRYTFINNDTIIERTSKINDLKYTLYKGYAFVVNLFLVGFANFHLLSSIMYKSLRDSPDVSKSRHF